MARKRVFIYKFSKKGEQNEMKGIIKGFEPVDYMSKKTGQPVKGATIYFDCKSKDVFGYVGKNEYIAESSPLYKRCIEPIFDKLCDEDSDIYGL